MVFAVTALVEVPTMDHESTKAAHPGGDGGLHEDDNRAGELVEAIDTEAAADSPSSRCWRDVLRVHTAANLFPMMAETELSALADDIEVNGITSPIAIWSPDKDFAAWCRRRTKRAPDFYLVDGRNRLSALESRGLLEFDEVGWPFINAGVPIGVDRTIIILSYGDDPFSYVASANLHRRHLTSEQKRELVGRLLKAQPGASNRTIARQAKVDHKTVATVREEGEGRGEIPHVEARVVHPAGADYFPTPPFGTRALMQHVLPHLGIDAHKLGLVLEPACGEGHMAEVLSEFVADVMATDLFPYGYGLQGYDFLKDPIVADWIITNPPFDKALQFTLHAMAHAKVGVAMFVRLQWLESVGRYESLFRDQQPTLVAIFSERVPICEGRWDPSCSTAMAYCWLVWIKGHKPQATFWIPPCRKDLTKPDDAERFTAHPVIRVAKQKGAT